MQQPHNTTALVAGRSDVSNSLTIEGMPAGFVALPDGIYQLGTAEDDDPIWLCSPVAVTALFRTSAGAGWGRTIELLDPDRRLKTLTLFDKDIEARPGKTHSNLADNGLRSRSGPAARAAINCLIRDWWPATVLTSTDRLGWADEACSGFLFGDGRVLGGGRYHYTGGAFDAASLARASAATVDAWRDNVAALCCGNPLLILSVSLAFSGPLLELLNEEGGGIHLRGASSCGKTTIQRVAVSVWGDPGHLGTWRVTASGVETVARANNSKLLALDEIAEISAQDLYQAAYMLANGMGKVRANSAGNAIPRAAWRVAILSTGELSVAEKLAEAGRKAMAGQEVRLLDIEADAGRYGAFDDLHDCTTGAAFSKRLKRAVAGSYGTAGPALVETLISRRMLIEGWARKAIDSMLDGMRRKFAIADDGQALRAARRLAVIACAGEIATNAGLTGWAKGDAVKAAEVALSLWLETRRPTQTDEGVEAVERTRAFLSENADGFAEPGIGDAATRATSFGWKDAGLFHIPRDVWLALHGQKATDAARQLERSGFLVRGEGNHLARKAPHWIEGRPRFYVVRAAILVGARPAASTEVAA